MIGNNWASDFETSTTGLEIRYGNGKWAGFKTHRLLAPRLRPYCTPRMAIGLNKPEDLLQLQLIEVMGTQVGWADWFEAQGLRGIQLPSRHSVDSFSFSVPMTVNNLGACLSYEEFCTSGPLAQALIRPFPEEVQTPDSYYLTYREEHQLSSNEMLFLQWLLDSLPNSDQS
jgi:LysR family glycine cleavage system transcriptional activator